VSKEYAVPIDSVIIEDLKISPGSKKGDGYSCLISALDFVATIDNVKHEKHYIAKYANDDGRKAMLNMVYLRYFLFLTCLILHKCCVIKPTEQPFQSLNHPPSLFSPDPFSSLIESLVNPNKHILFKE